jgi:shikimate kinase
MIIYLIGYRCTGKTSVGKRLAKKFGWPFVDADLALVEKYQTTISEIVSAQGWDSFREKETYVLKALSNLDNHVIATGGGVILKKENVECMKKNGVIIWLKANRENIKKRMLEDQNTQDQRPSLTPKKLDDEIKETLLSRTPLYEDAMEFYVDTDDLSVDGVCETIIQKLDM